MGTAELETARATGGQSTRRRWYSGSERGRYLATAARGDAEQHRVHLRCEWNRLGIRHARLEPRADASRIAGYGRISNSLRGDGPHAADCLHDDRDPVPDSPDCVAAHLE